MPRQTQARQALEDHQVAIARAFERGRELQDIAKKYDVSTMTVHNWLKTLGYKHAKGRGRYPKAMLGRARDLASRGWSTEAISKLLKVRPEQVQTWVEAAPIENPKGFKRKSKEAKDSARSKKLAELEKRRAKKGKRRRVPDPAKLEEIEEEAKKAKEKKPRGRPPKTTPAEPYPPPRHRCNKHWTEPEERYVLELIREGKEPQFIYHRMRASKQRQRRIWRKYGGSGDPPNFPPPREGRPPEGPAPAGAPAVKKAPEPPKLPPKVVEALAGEIEDSESAKQRLAALKKKREELEKEAKKQASELKKLKEATEQQEQQLDRLEDKERKLEQKQLEQKKKLEEKQKALKEAEEKAQEKPKKPKKEKAKPLPPAKKLVPPTLKKFIDLGRNKALRAFEEAEPDEETQDVIEAVRPVYEDELNKITKDTPQFRDSLGLFWSSAYETILPRFAELEDVGESSKIAQDPEVKEAFDELLEQFKAANQQLGAKAAPKSREPRKPRRQREPGPLLPPDLYSQRFIHQQYAPDKKNYAFGPKWKKAYRPGSEQRKIFESASRKELKELSEVLEKRFGFPNKLVTQGKLPEWWGGPVSKARLIDDDVPEEVFDAFTLALKSFPEILQRLRQRRDQLYRGSASEKTLKALKPKRPKKPEAKALPEEQADAQAEYQQEKDQYLQKKKEYEGAVRRSEERKMLTADIARWIEKLGDAIQAKEKLNRSTDPAQEPKLRADFETATSEYRRVWNAMSEPDRLILDKNLKFADLRGRPTDRGVRYAKYLLKKYGKELQKNPGLPWMDFCEKHNLC